MSVCLYSNGGRKSDFLLSRSRSEAVGRTNGRASWPKIGRRSGSPSLGISVRKHKKVEQADTLATTRKPLPLDRFTAQAAMMSLEEFKELTYKWPFVITAACLYTVTVKYFNTSRPKPAAAFTNTATFKYLCVVHNAALAAYSAWTFISAIPIINQQAWRTDIPIVQRICSADEAVFDNGLDHLTWLFYLSKFYEVLDTAIILAKGKKSPLLQTYHHAGAMLTLFAGSKYKATPIWLFVVFNSFIHSIMCKWIDGY